MPCLQHKHFYASLHSLWRLPCSSIRNQGQAGNKWCMLCNLCAQFPSMDTTQKKGCSSKLFCTIRVKSLGLPHSYRYSQKPPHALAVVSLECGRGWNTIKLCEWCAGWGNHESLFPAARVTRAVFAAVQGKKGHSNLCCNKISSLRAC